MKAKVKRISNASPEEIESAIEKMGHDLKNDLRDMHWQGNNPMQVSIAEDGGFTTIVVWWPN